MDNFGRLLGALLFIGGIALGLYVFGYVCLFGGIVNAIEAFRASPVNVGAGVGNILLVIFSEILGVLAASIPCVIGGILFTKDY